MSYRVALLGIYHESNTFLDKHTTLTDFEKGHWLFGEDIINEYRKAYHEIGGMIEVTESEQIELIPVMYAEATPGGTITSATCNILIDKLMEALDKVLPVDGCLVVPHGAAVSENFPDMDGYWLGILREKVGSTSPIIGTIDPHANVSTKMAEVTDGLVAYKTNPHIDQRQVGKDAALMLVRYLKKEIKPVQQLFQLPMAISIEQQYTGRDPCKSLYEYAGDLAREKVILSVSIVLGFPYADVKEMGSSIIIISDNDKEAAQAVGEKIQHYLLERKESFVGDKKDVQAVYQLLPLSDKPVLLLDMGDNVGGGAPGNSTFLLEALEKWGRCKFFICIYDPEAVQEALRHIPGDKYFTHFGLNENSVETAMEVNFLRSQDGKFREKDPRHGGQVSYDMGMIALVSSPQGNTIMLISQRIPPFSLAQLTAFGISPRDYDVVIAKGVNAPIAAYAPVCGTIIQVDTPGMTRADMTLFHYTKRRVPLFPFEN